MLMVACQLAMAISITNVSTTQPKCGGDGSIRIDTDASTFRYSLDNGSSWTLSSKAYIQINNMEEGSYNIQVKAGITTTTVVYTGNPVILNAATTAELTEVNTTNASDCVLVDGVIELVATGSPAEYTIDGGTSWTSSDAISAAAGTYVASDIQVKSSTDCISVWTEDDIIVGDDIEYLAEAMDYTTIPPSCIGENDGQISLSLTEENITYSIDGGSTFSDDPYFIGLSGGQIYPVKVNYNNSCYYNGPNIELPNPQQATIDEISTTSSSITITASEQSGDDNGILREDMGDITYSIDNGETFQASNEFTGLAFGDYIVLIKYGECETACENNPVNIGSVVTIPDANFKAALVANYDNNNDGEIQIYEAKSVTGTIDVSNQSISNLTGIEAFFNITQLKCNSNSLTSIDVSKNTALTNLHCANNSLASLNISDNLALNVLYCYYNQITSLDVSSNVNLTTLQCFSNQLNRLNIANGNCSAYTSMELFDNPNLSCVAIDEGFTPPAPGIDGWDYDQGLVSFSPGCASVIIPDANFKAYLVASYDTSGDGEIQTPEAQAASGTLYISNRSISDLTGIEAFVNITGLSCSSNLLTSLDLSNNIALTSLFCNSNLLTSLDLSNNTALTSLNCMSNLLTSLDLSNNTELISLSCQSNQLANLSIDANTALSYLSCGSNQFSSLSVSSNTELTDLWCANNNITNLDVSNNTELTKLDCSRNQLTSLDVSNNTALTFLNCDSNQLNNLNIANGNCNAYTRMWLFSNTNLSCVQIDEGFTPPASGSGGWTYDSGVSFSTDCSIPSAKLLPFMLPMGQIQSMQQRLLLMEQPCQHSIRVTLLLKMLLQVPTLTLLKKSDTKI